jgi:endonuclease-3
MPFIRLHRVLPVLVLPRFYPGPPYARDPKLAGWTPPGPWGKRPPMARQLPYSDLVEIFTRFRDESPEPKGELDHVNAYTLVVAVALSAQATDKGVNRATSALFKIADTPGKMLELGEDGLIAHIKTIGLFRNKAKNVIKLSRILVEEYGGEVPASRAALESLPGVGRKTANVVLNMWWGMPTQAVDTHIFRVGNRTGIAPGKDVNVVERAIEDNIPAPFQHHAHHWLILHGRYVCKARSPDCPNCLIRDLCRFEEKTQPPAPKRPKGVKLAQSKAKDA